MASNGGPRAWAFLPRNPVYGAACRAAFGHPAFEVAPFPLRIQSRADRKAFAWGLLAWEIPDGTGDSPSPFCAGAPTLDGEWGTEAPPLAPLLANAGARLSGLRLADGRLILKIENRSQAAQVRLRSGLVHAGLESGVATGLVPRLAFGSGPMLAIKRLETLASLARDRGGTLRRAARSGRVAHGKLDALARAPAGQEGPFPDGGRLSGPGGRAVTAAADRGPRPATQGGVVFENCKTTLPHRCCLLLDCRACVPGSSGGARRRRRTWNLQRCFSPRPRPPNGSASRLARSSNIAGRARGRCFTVSGIWCATWRQTLTPGRRRDAGLPLRTTATHSGKGPGRTAADPRDA